MAEYTPDQRLAKLVKLRELSEHPGTPEHQANAARGLLDRLIKQWEVDPAELESEKVENHFFNVPKFGKDLALQVAFHMELSVYSTNKRMRLCVAATATDYALFAAYFVSLLKALKDKQKRYALELKSYMKGLSTTAFPSFPTCSKCKSKGIKYNPLERRVICPDCGYQSRPIKLKANETDMDALSLGMRDGQKLTPSRHLEAA